jgi:hypothetical protein
MEKEKAKSIARLRLVPEAISLFPKSVANQRLPRPSFEGLAMVLIVDK